MDNNKCSFLPVFLYLYCKTKEWTVLIEDLNAEIDNYITQFQASTDFSSEFTNYINNISIDDLPVLKYFISNQPTDGEEKYNNLTTLEKLITFWKNGCQGSTPTYSANIENYIASSGLTQEEEKRENDIRVIMDENTYIDECGEAHKLYTTMADGSVYDNLHNQYIVGGENNG